MPFGIEKCLVAILLSILYTIADNSYTHVFAMGAFVCVHAYMIIEVYDWVLTSVCVCVCR